MKQTYPADYRAVQWDTTQPSELDLITRKTSPLPTFELYKKGKRLFDFSSDLEASDAVCAGCGATDGVFRQLFPLSSWTCYDCE